MKTTKFLLAASCLALLIGSVIPAFADDAATKDDATKMVKTAVADLKAGKDVTLTEISNPKGKYVKNDLYLTVYDLTGKCLAHGNNAALVGKDLSALKDVDKKPFVQERITSARTQDSFWQDYKYMNPVTHAVAMKSSYCEKADDMVVCGGVYK